MILSLFLSLNDPQITDFSIILYIGLLLNRSSYRVSISEALLCWQLKDSPFGKLRMLECK